MKVLHINSYYSYSKFYKHFYEEQIKSGLDINVFIPVTKDFASGFDFGSYSIVSKNHNKYDRYFFHIKQRKVIRDIQTKYDISKFSIIHAHSLFTNGYVAYKLFEQYKVPYIVAVRNTDINVFFKKMVHLRKLGVNILLNANNIILISHSYKNILLDKYIPVKFKEIIKQKTSVIPNGIDKYWLDNKPNYKEKSFNGEIKILQVGDINRNKNYLTTLKAIQVLRDSGYSVRLTIVGKNKDNRILKKLIKYDYVQYLPHTTRENLINIYRNHDIFVLPSIRETFGLVYGEAMSQGLPVIYTKGQGFDGQFKDGKVGYPVNCLDHIEVANRIIDITIRYNQISSNCINNCQRFSWKSIINDYKGEIY